MESYAPWVKSVCFYDTIDINEHLLSVKVELGDVMYFFVPTAWNIKLSFFFLAYFSPRLSKATSSEDYTRWCRQKVPEEVTAWDKKQDGEDKLEGAVLAS